MSRGGPPRRDAGRNRGASNRGADRRVTTGRPSVERSVPRRSKPDRERPARRRSGGSSRTPIRTAAIRSGDRSAPARRIDDSLRRGIGARSPKPLAGPLRRRRRLHDERLRHGSFGRRNRATATGIRGAPQRPIMSLMCGSRVRIPWEYARTSRAAVRRLSPDPPPIRLRERRLRKRFGLGSTTRSAAATRMPKSDSAARRRATIGAGLVATSCASRIRIRWWTIGARNAPVRPSSIRGAPPCSAADSY